MILSLETRAQSGAQRERNSKHVRLELWLSDLATGAGQRVGSRETGMWVCGGGYHAQFEPGLVDWQSR